jgi:hypothetical protein
MDVTLGGWALGSTVIVRHHSSQSSGHSDIMAAFSGGPQAFDTEDLAAGVA